MKPWKIKALREGSPVPIAGMEQARYTEVAEITIVCKFCESDQVIRWGTKKGIQRYFCKACGRKFVANNALAGMRYPPEQIGAALNMFYGGKSLNDIRLQMEQDFGIKPSDSTVYEWIVRFTKQAVDGMREMGVAQTGDLWAADETVLKVAGSKTKEGAANTIWFWDVIDEETKLLVASHMSERRTITDAVTLFTRASALVDNAPRNIITDKLAAYADGIERVFGADTCHVLSGGIRSESHNNIIERFHGTLKDRTKVMRGMKNKDTARLILDGWLIHYNFFRPHESLHGETPGEAAKAAYPWRNWRAVVEHGHISTERRETTRIRAAEG